MQKEYSPIDNEAFWDSVSRAEGYARRQHLYDAEQRFIDEHLDVMGGWKILDLGIGGGRTTMHFAPLVKEYVGTDYSKIMVQQCVSRLQTDKALLKNITLDTVDVRDLRRYHGSDFNLVLFSFNGIDEISHEDRTKALLEVRSVLRTDGLFFFSSHNLLSVQSLFAFKLLGKPSRLWKHFRRAVALRSANRGVRRSVSEQPFAMIHDYPQDLAKLTYYVHPNEQLRQIEEAGYSSLKIYGSKTKRILGLADHAISDEPWLYYLCIIK